MDKQLELDLKIKESKQDGPVTCLGLEFPDNEARRAHFTELLREKLKEPEFREIEGFPIGENEDILTLSDPPYYTACPNPWVDAFIDEWGAEKPEKPEGLVVDKVDKIMHGAQLGAPGMHNQIAQWVGTGFLDGLFQYLLELDFQIWLTSDHGNIECRGIR
jgi:hypothetical protein